MRWAAGVILTIGTFVFLRDRRDAAQLGRRRPRRHRWRGTTEYVPSFWMFAWTRVVDEPRVRARRTYSSGQSDFQQRREADLCSRRSFLFRRRAGRRPRSRDVSRPLADLVDEFSTSPGARPGT